MFRIIILAALLVAGTFVTEASAQNVRLGINTGFGNFYNPYCVNAQWGYGRGSTVYGDRMRGNAAFYQSYGAYLQQRAAAAYIYESARRQHIDNWYHYVETRQLLKDQYAARQAAKYEAIRRRNLERKKK